ncbi:MAG: glycosyltransferase [Odoribacteraceae bacterium]|jgi:glycosyltransferase involved in cell wall biosynthesis|nr:glycosyltransferase [Odoribacteraceae bacterium]
MTSKRNCIIVPCYNEAKRLDAGTFLSFTRREADIDVCFVDDGSTDGTPDLLRLLADQSPGRVHFLRLERNSGKAEAVRAGILHVAGDYDAVGFMDADLATSLEEMLRLAGIREREGSPAVIGSRVRRLGVQIDRTAFRHYSGRFFATVVSLLFRLNAYDTQCGAKIFDARVAREIFRAPFLSKWLFDVELLLRLRRLPGEPLRHVQEIPLHAWHERPGSKIKPSYLFRVPLELYKIWREYRGK